MLKNPAIGDNRAKNGRMAITYLGIKTIIETENIDANSVKTEIIDGLVEYKTKTTGIAQSAVINCK